MGGTRQETDFNFPSNVLSSGQITVGSGTAGDFAGGSLRANGQNIVPVNVGTGLNENNYSGFGSASLRMRESFFTRLFSTLGEGNGYAFTGSGSSARLWASIGTGGGATIRGATGRQKAKFCSTAGKGVIVTDQTIGSSTETDDDIALQISGNGLIRLEGQQAGTIEALTLNDGCIFYIDDTTGGTTINAVGYWGVKAGSFVQII